MKQELESEEKAKQEELVNAEKRRNNVQSNEDNSEINISTPEIVTVDVDSQLYTATRNIHNSDERKLDVQKDDENDTKAHSRERLSVSMVLRVPD